MKWVFRLFKLLLLMIVVAFFHYHLPDRDIVQVTGTEVKRMDIGHNNWIWGRPDAGTQSEGTRDVRFITADWPNGNPRVYRNEDTDWGWPPYFKFDSGNLQGQAQSLGNRNGSEDIWVAVTHYGWRIELFSMYPNAMKIKRVEGPDTLLIPWFNIVLLSLIFGLLLWIWLKWRGFRKKRLDPIGDRIDATADDAREDFQKRRTGFSAFMRRWFGSAKKEPKTGAADTPKSE